VSLRSGIAIVLLAAAAAASYYWSRQPPLEITRRHSGDDAGLPGYYLHGARLTGTDDEGRVAYRVHADSLEEQGVAEGLAMSGVRVVYTPADDVAWVIEAAEGSGPRDGSHLELDGGVQVRNQPADGAEPTVITTTNVRFEPGASLLVTDAPIEIRAGGWQVAATGLRAHLKDDKLELESKVHGTFGR
jgi:lipopolysaccharide export system protein LptC